MQYRGEECIVIVIRMSGFFVFALSILDMLILLISEGVVHPKFLKISFKGANFDWPDINIFEVLSSPC